MNYIEEKLVFKYGIPIEAIEACPDTDWEGILERLDREV